MRRYRYVVLLAVVLAASHVAAQEADKPKADEKPWWMAKPAQAVPVRPSAAPQARPAVRVQAAVARPQVAKVQPREQLIYRLANLPAVDVARSVNQLLADDQKAADKVAAPVVLLPEPITNSILISGTAEQIRKATRLLQELDKQPLMVCAQVVVATIKPGHGFSLLDPNADGPVLSCSHEEACELIEQFRDSKAVEILARPQIMTLDNQPAFIQIGQRVPVVHIRSGKDGQTVATELENVGLIVGITPRISPERTVALEVDVEKSDLGPESQGVPIGVDGQGNVIRSPRINVMTVHTTVNIPPGRAVILGGLTAEDGKAETETVIVLTLHVVAQKK